VSAPSGWTTVAATSNTGVATTILWRLATGGDPSSWTFTLSASQKAAGQIVAYSGVHPTYPIDVTATAATASGTAHAVPPVTTTEDNRLLLTVAAAAIDTTWTPAAGTFERIDVAALTGAPTVTVHLGEHAQAAEGLSTSQTPTAAAAATGATMTVALRPANSTIATKTLRYSYSGGADTTALTLTTANVIVDRTISLPGGVVVSGVSASVATWAYPNIHGDITYTINQTGAVSGPYLYDPYGQTLTSLPNTSPGDFDNGWLGQHQRPTEQQPELKTTIEMGARPYRPDLGRFLRLDPIVGGVTYSDYSYVVDPVNSFDLSGNCPICVPVVPVAAPAISAGAVALFGGIVVAGVAIGNFISSIDITAPWSGGIDLTEFIEKIDAMQQQLLKEKEKQNVFVPFTNRWAAVAAARKYANQGCHGLERLYRSECRRGGHVHVDVVKNSIIVKTMHYVFGKS